MGRWHVGFGGGEAAPALTAAAHMASHALAAMQNPDAGSGDPRSELPPDQGARHAVTMALDFNLIVDVRLDGLEVSYLITLRG